MTIILKKNEKISSLICNGGDYVGIRIPDNKDLIEIINKLGRPVISTSANISDNDVITRVDMIEEELLKNIDYVEDGGEIVSLSSSVVRVVDGELIILREGKISDEIKVYYMANLKK
jgi:L-threonylcarbamoyladenylate synthase